MKHTLGYQKAKDTVTKDLGNETFQNTTFFYIDFQKVSAKVLHILIRIKTSLFWNRIKSYGTLYSDELYKS